MTLLERYCAWSIEELNDETGLYTEEKLMVALDNIVTSKRDNKIFHTSFIRVNFSSRTKMAGNCGEVIC